MTNSHKAEPVCGRPEASCICIEPPDHAGPHVCACGGSWSITDGGHLEPGANWGYSW